MKLEKLIKDLGLENEEQLIDLTIEYQDKDLLIVNELEEVFNVIANGRGDTYAYE